MRRAMLLGLLVACSSSAPAPKLPPAPAPAPDAAVPDAAPPDAAPPTPYDAFDAALAAVGLTRAVGDGVEIHTTTCDGATIGAIYKGAEVQVRFGGCFRCELDGEIDPVRMAEFATALAEEPPAFYRTAQVTQAAVCTRLTMDEQVEMTEGMLIGGTVDAIAGMILISLEPMELTGHDIVHHELFHAFDFRTDFKLYKDDPAWKKLNTVPYGHSDDTRAGYLNTHARDNLREDHATTYQYLMARPDELCAGDAIVLAKARMIRDRVADALGDASYLEDRAPCLK